MAEIKTDETQLERSIEIKRRRFNRLLITRVTRHDIGSSSEIQWPQLNGKYLESCVSS